MSSEAFGAILGIDPGLARTGYGVVTVNPNNALQGVAWGAIKTTATSTLHQRLLQIYCELEQVILTYKPSILAVEFPFHHLNIKTSVRLGQVQGVAILAAAKAGILVAEYSPREIKQATVGYGAGSKEQVMYMVGKILNLTQDFECSDCADALAVAICHANAQLLHRQLSKGRS